MTNPSTSKLELSCPHCGSLQYETLGTVIFHDKYVRGSSNVTITPYQPTWSDVNEGIQSLGSEVIQRQVPSELNLSNDEGGVAVYFECVRCNGVGKLFVGTLPSHGLAVTASIVPVDCSEPGIIELKATREKAA